jgi:hypothetical protein
VQQPFWRTIMARLSLVATAVALSLLSSGAFLAAANAASYPRMQASSAQWQSMKTACTTNGMKWKDYLKTCGGSAAQTASAQSSVAPVVGAKAAPKPVRVSKAAKAPAAATASPLTNLIKKFATNGSAAQAAASGAAASASGGRLAQQSRIKACGAQWQSANTLPLGKTLPQFWSACDAQMKASG